MTEKTIQSFYPSSRQAWRNWLEENHANKESVWLICYKIKTGTPTISWTDAVEEALCFGWIDSIRKSLDDEKFIQLFSKRKPRSTWSKINKEKIQKFINDGSITQLGLESIAIAKQNGSWSILDEVEKLTIPTDLEKAFKAQAGSKDFFLSLSKSVQKSILQWIVLARQETTREKRITEVATLSAQKLKPKHLR